MYAEQQKSQFAAKARAEAMAQTACGVIGSGYPEPPRDVSGVERSVTLLRQQVAELGVCVENMGRRLQPVLLPEPASPLTGNAAPAPMECDLAANINEVADSLNRMAQIMRGYMSRMEI